MWQWSLVFRIDSYIFIYFSSAWPCFCPPQENENNLFHWFDGIPSIQWLHNFIDYTKLYCPLENPSEKSLHLSFGDRDSRCLCLRWLEHMSHCCHWVLRFELCRSITNVVQIGKGKKAPPCKVNWLKFIYLFLCSFCFFNRKFQHNRFNKIEKFSRISNQFRLNAFILLGFSLFFSAEKGESEGQKDEIWKSDGNRSKANRISHNFQQFIAFYYYFLMRIFFSISLYICLYTHTDWSNGIETVGWQQNYNETKKGWIQWAGKLTVFFLV